MTAASLVAGHEREATTTGSARDASLAQYLAAIGSHPLLGQEEEARLARLAAAGDERAKRRLVEANLRLVVSIARRYRGLGLDLLDLIQEGNIGLMTAAGRYDCRRDVRFAGYASWWIRREICRALSAKSRLVRLPHRLAQSATRVGQAERALAQRHRRRPTIAEVAHEAGVTERAVVDLRRASIVPVSISEPRGEEAAGLGESTHDVSGDPASALAAADDAAGIDGALATLEARQRRLLELRYGLDGHEPRSLSDVASELGISCERARWIETKTLHALRGSDRLQALRAAA